MTEFDTIIRDGTVVTAADRMQCDVAIKDGIVVALGHDLGTAERTIDTGGKLVLPRAPISTARRRSARANGPRRAWSARC